MEPLLVGVLFGFFAGWNISTEVHKPQPQVQIQQPAAMVAAEKGDK